jgi:hypothetical protein
MDTSLSQLLAAHDRCIAAMDAASKAHRDAFSEGIVRRGWLKRGGLRWSVWCARTTILGVAASHAAMAAPSAYVVGLPPSHASITRAVLAIRTSPVDSAALRAWLSALPTPTYDENGNTASPVRLSTLRFDPAVLLSLASMAALPGELTLGVGSVGEAPNATPTVVIRGEGWMWASASLNSPDGDVVTAFPAKGGA